MFLKNQTRKAQIKQYITFMPKSFAVSAHDTLTQRTGCRCIFSFFIQVDERRAFGIRAVVVGLTIQELLVILKWSLIMRSKETNTVWYRTHPCYHMFLCQNLLCSLILQPFRPFIQGTLGTSNGKNDRSGGFPAWLRVQFAYDVLRQASDTVGMVRRTRKSKAKRKFGRRVGRLRSCKGRICLMENVATYTALGI